MCVCILCTYVLFWEPPPRSLHGCQNPGRQRSCPPQFHRRTCMGVWRPLLLGVSRRPPRLLPRPVAVHNIMTLSDTTPCVTAPQFGIACSTLAIAARKRLVLNSVSSWLREMGCDVFWRHPPYGLLLVGDNRKRDSCSL